MSSSSILQLYNGLPILFPVNKGPYIGLVDILSPALSIIPYRSTKFLFCPEDTGTLSHMWRLAIYYFSFPLEFAGHNLDRRCLSRTHEISCDKVSTLLQQRPTDQQDGRLVKYTCTHRPIQSRYDIYNVKLEWNIILRIPIIPSFNLLLITIHISNHHRVDGLEMRRDRQLWATISVPNSSDESDILCLWVFVDRHVDPSTLSNQI